MTAPFTTARIFQAGQQPKNWLMEGEPGDLVFFPVDPELGRPVGAILRTHRGKRFLAITWSQAWGGDPIVWPYQAGVTFMLRGGRVLWDMTPTVGVTAPETPRPPDSSAELT